MGFTTTPLTPTKLKMHLKTILNHVEKQKGFVYCEARWSKKREIEFVLMPRKGSKPTGAKRLLYVAKDRTEASLQGARRLQSILDVHIGNLGIEVFARLVHASKPIANRADTKDGCHVAQA